MSNGLFFNNDNDAALMADYFFFNRIQFFFVQGFCLCYLDMFWWSLHLPQKCHTSKNMKTEDIINTIELLRIVIHYSMITFKNIKLSFLKKKNFKNPNRFPDFICFNVLGFFLFNLLISI